MDHGCAVCLEAIKGEDAAATLPCGHRFHTVCAINVFRRYSTCPICRASVGGLVEDAPQPSAQRAAHDVLNHLYEEMERATRERAEGSRRELRIRRQAPNIARQYECVRERSRDAHAAERRLNEFRSSLWQETVRQNDTSQTLARELRNARARVRYAERKYRSMVDAAMDRSE